MTKRPNKRLDGTGAYCQAMTSHQVARAGKKNEARRPTSQYFAGLGLSNRRTIKASKGGDTGRRNGSNSGGACLNIQLASAT